MENSPVRRTQQDAQPILVPSAAPPPFGGYVEIDSPDSGGNELSQWLQYLQVLMRRKGTLAVIALCGVLLAFLVSLYQTPLYMASATLEIQNLSPEPFEGLRFMNSGDPYQLQTQLQLLRSRALRERVNEKLYSAPSGSGPGANSLDSMRQWLRLPSRKAPTWQEGLAVAMETVQVTPVKDSRIVHIVGESTVPQAAADYANTLAEQFIEQTLEEKWTLYQSTGAWLTRAQEELRAKLEASERELLTYANESGLVVTSGGQDDVQNIGEQKLLQLQAELTRAQADRIVKESIYREHVQGAPSDGGNVLDSGPMASYQTKLADLRRELAAATTSLTESHPKVQRLLAQVAEVEAAQATERSYIVGRMRTDYEAARRRENQLSADFASESKVVSSQDQKLIRYKTLKREVETYRSLFETTLKQGNEAAVASALRPGGARVVDRARTAKLPFKPDVARNVSLGLVGGLFVGIAFVLLRERTDSLVRAPGANQRQFNVRELGVIPSAGVGGELLPAANARKALRSLLGATGSKPHPLTSGGQAADGIELVTWNRRGSVVAESFRAVLTSILMARQNGNPTRAILVTSPSPQEGKSTVVTNLGVALAEINQRVLLIDADVRRPRLHTIFKQANTWGLVDLLNDGTPCSEYPVEALARKTHIPGLFTLPSGPISIEAPRLLYSPRMAELLDRLRREFDAVLIDTPPVLSVADARILSRLVDAVLLVFRAGQTAKEAANMALGVFEADGVTVLGTVLNDWDPRSASYGSYASYASHDYATTYAAESYGDAPHRGAGPGTT